MIGAFKMVDGQALKCSGCGVALKPKPDSIETVWVTRNDERFRLLAVKCECEALTYVQIDSEETLEQLNRLEAMAKHAVNRRMSKSKKEFNIARKHLEEMRRELVLKNNNKLFAYDDGRTFILRLAVAR